MWQSKGCIILVAIRWFSDIKIIMMMIIIIENDDIINIIISSFSCDNLYLAKLTGKNKNLEVENIFVVIFDTC